MNSFDFNDQYDEVFKFCDIIKISCFNIHLNTSKKIQVHENICPTFVSNI